mmetsp:Transcript_6937/g.9629  ORF Transcript_6937/g.9629 Transcript_6937/m.9629 type:complete len:86 (-) Transcript_6937:257-514(-)
MRLGFADTLGSEDESLWEALEENEAKLHRLREEILSELERRQAALAAPASPASGDCEIDLEGLLEACEAIRAETGVWRGLRDIDH